MEGSQEICGTIRLRCTNEHRGDRPAGGRVPQHRLLRAHRQAARLAGDPQRIQAVIDELGYRPNAAARALKEGRTRTIGLVIPPASQRLTDMQLGFVASVVEAAARADLDVLLSRPAATTTVPSSASSPAGGWTA